MKAAVSRRWKSSAHRDPSQSRGQSLVEFALIAPAFLIMIFAIMESALLINAQVTLDNATRAAARAAAICGTTTNPTYQDPYTGLTHTAAPPNANVCQQVAWDTVRSALGILPSSGLTGNPDPIVASPAQVTSDCPSGNGGAYNAVQGCTISVSTSYTYAFLLNFLVGPGAPSVTLSSSATAVSQ